MTPAGEPVAAGRRAGERMTEAIPLRATACAYCETLGNAVQIYPANFEAQDFNPAVFSARRLPDRLHYRIVRCQTCGLLRSDPVTEPELLKRLYAQSEQTYGSELPNLRETYGKYLDMLDRFGTAKNCLLEVGCGSGFFLQEARLRGFQDAWGIEPSQAAAAQAAPELRSRIICDVLRPGLFPDGTFDVICMFQVFDHLPDPNSALGTCLRMLGPGGLMLALNHDAGSFTARLLGERSPIIDIEHTYLYDMPSMQRMLRKHSFEVLRQGSATNLYSLQYLVQLLPLPHLVKDACLRLLQKTGFGRVRLWATLGNLYIIARRPA